MRLTPAQRELARHALGMREGETQSYRNRFHATPGSPDHAEWLRICRKNAAQMRAGRVTGTTLDLYWLTRQGALAALAEGETLDPEDFPPAGVP